MAEHVDVDWEADLGFLAQRLTNRFMASRVNGAPRSPTLRHLVSGIMRMDKIAINGGFEIRALECERGRWRAKIRKAAQATT